MMYNSTSGTSTQKTPGVTWIFRIACCCGPGAGSGRDSTTCLDHGYTFVMSTQPPNASH